MTLNFLMVVHVIQNNFRLIVQCAVKDLRQIKINIE